jgi:exodeoxyribonuclease VII large subunit
MLATAQRTIDIGDTEYILLNVMAGRQGQLTFDQIASREDPRPIGVSEVSGLIETLLDDQRLQEIWVRGEITNYTHHSSGHRYFSLSEVRFGKVSTIQCVIWRSDAARIRIDLDNGMDLLLFGSVGLYPPQGRYQFYAKEVRLAGEGEKHLLVERWRRELDVEGLFAEGRKRSLPRFPRTVGVVTSSTGAVLQDIRNVISRRFPLTLVISPTVVQGETAHIEIAAAIRRIDTRVDVIIVARGGGSFEDLFPFNHPDVVRAVAACVTPVVSAVGHEVDVTLCDLAADLRAPTPSSAAELVVPDRGELISELLTCRQHLIDQLIRRVEKASAEVTGLAVRLHPGRLGRLVNRRREDLANLSERLDRALAAGMVRRRSDIREQKAIVEAGNPLRLLNRGYCVIERENRPITSAHQITKGDQVLLRLADGTGIAKIKEVTYDRNI